MEIRSILIIHLYTFPHINVSEGRQFYIFNLRLLLLVPCENRGLVSYCHNPPADENNHLSYHSMRWQTTLIFCSVRFARVLGPLQLDLEPLGADLVAVHGLDGGVGCFVGGERDKSCLIWSYFLTSTCDDLPKHLERFVCLSMKTLAETMVPKGWNVWLRSESVNSCWERRSIRNHREDFWPTWGRW